MNKRTILNNWHRLLEIEDEKHSDRQKAKITPGPGAYNHKESIAVEKDFKSPQINIPFNTTQIKEVSLAEDQAMRTARQFPGPGQYNHNQIQTSQNKNWNKSTWNMMSNTIRDGL